ncbi:hypothetical protein EB796_008015 [Bugula neritina]|uniref:Guanylate-binding protein N-terminal domain-containing protein n=1 Tax=Bugula neritina TaxID=10212 RepID=A0A7J7K4W3_BUGNE|nr:hypothetical protein EB796_008015 [Bugula neritina]
MDCQGTGDARLSSPTLDNLILYMGVQMASIQILNLKGVLQATDLERLDLCADYAEADPESKALFNSLVFLIRDWEGDDELGEKKEELNDIMKEAKAEVIKKFGRGIKRAFRSVTTYALPHPGPNITRSSDDGKTKVRVNFVDIGEDYLMAAKHFFHRLFIESPKPSELQRGKFIVKKFRSLRDRIIDPDIGGIKIQTASEAFQESLLGQAFIESTEFYDSMMTKVYDQHLETEEELLTVLLNIVDETVENFRNKKTIQKYKESSTSKKYLELLVQKKEGLTEKTKFIMDATNLKREKEVFEKKILQQQRSVEELKAKYEKLAEQRKQEVQEKKTQQKTLADEAAAAVKKGVSGQLGKVKEKEVLMEENRGKRRQLEEKEALLKRNVAEAKGREKLEAERREKLEAERREKLEAERRKKMEAERREKLEAEKREKLEKEKQQALLEKQRAELKQKEKENQKRQEVMEAEKKMKEMEQQMKECKLKEEQQKKEKDELERLKTEIKKKETTRERLLRQAEERMREERKRMEQLAEQLKQKNEQQDDAVPEERWIGRAEDKIGVKDKSCTIL